MSKVVYSVISGKYGQTEKGLEENVKYARDFDNIEDAKKEYDFNSDYAFNRIELYIDDKKIGTITPD